MEVTRDGAWELFCEWTQSDSLRTHVLGVEAAMVGYAREYGEDAELWAATGILHDLDYEKYPDLETGHPRVALALFEERGYPPELIDAVAGHAEFLNHPRTTPLAKTLFAVDELSGFVAACALGVDFDDHLQRVITAMEAPADELGLRGQPEPSDHPA